MFLSISSEKVFETIIAQTLVHISIGRKALVRLFDKVARGSLKEGKKLSNMIQEIHRRRYGTNTGQNGISLSL